VNRQGFGIREQGLGAGFGGVVLLLVMGVAAHGQVVFGPSVSPDEFHPGGKQQHVKLMSDAAVVPAGQPQEVELVFKVQPGFHINSHTPKDELLIPTVFQMKTGEKVKVLGADYPHGSPFRLMGSTGEMLDVYQGEFRVGLRVIAPKGASTLVGSLRYQACDNAACFPAKTLSVKVAVTGQ
jgi:hypothetical protein